MFCLDDLIERCRGALAESEPAAAVADLLARAVADPAAVARALPCSRAVIVPLHRSPELTVLHVVWAPGMRFRPHNHRMWAAIGLYAGQEDNTFYRQEAGALAVSGGRKLGTGDVALLAADAIHAVTNPRASVTGAIHVYGGDIVARPGRSEWEDGSHREVPYDFERARQVFEAANR